MFCFEDLNSKLSSCVYFHHCHNVKIIKPINSPYWVLIKEQLKVEQNGAITAHCGNSECVCLDGVCFRASDAADAIPLPLVNGWEAHGQGYEQPSFTKSADGFVVVSGLLKGGGNYGTAFARLPEGFRPARVLSFGVNHHDDIMRVEVWPDGTISRRSGGQKWACRLDGISFYTPVASTV